MEDENISLASLAPQNIENTKEGVNTIDENCIRNLLAKLKFLAKLKAHERFNVFDMSIDDKTFYGSAKRRYFGESRDTAYEFISQLVFDSISLCQSLAKKDGDYTKNMAMIFKKNINESKNGIINICITYSDDRMFTSKLDVLLETMSMRLTELEREFKTK